jgi:ABC-2 type transport system permease protein
MQYSQFRAMWAITKASLRSTLRSPSAIVFSFIFPFVFIMVFGFIGNSGGMQRFRIVLAPGADTSNTFYRTLANTAGVKIVTYANEADMRDAVQKGHIAAVLHINKQPHQPLQVRMESTTSSNDKWPQVKTLIESTIAALDQKEFPERPTVAKFDFNYLTDIHSVRQYKTIDFILPGQLGFSLMSAAVFGVAFMFYNLRSTLVLKRFFATPIRKSFIIFGEGLSKVIFQMITAVVIIIVGHYLFGFTLIDGWITVLEMLFLSFVGLMVFMGFGFFVSGIAKSDSTIPPVANLITLPQFLLGETFFSIEIFPSWLQPIAKAMPLTYLNNAMRSVAFEGKHLWQILPEIGMLLAWGVLAYLLAARVFKWE